jgi:hypothetical protein
MASNGVRLEEPKGNSHVREGVEDGVSSHLTRTEGPTLLAVSHLRRSGFGLDFRFHALTDVAVAWRAFGAR